jgi:hypothetical protein
MHGQQSTKSFRKPAMHNKTGHYNTDIDKHMVLDLTYIQDVRPNHPRKAMNHFAFVNTCASCVRHFKASKDLILDATSPPGGDVRTFESGYRDKINR